MKNIDNCVIIKPYGESMTKKILIGNYKGGVGKTTSALNIAANLSFDNKVLLVDLDPQSSLSEICVPKNSNKSIGDFKSLADIDYIKYGKYFLNDIYQYYLDMENANAPIDRLMIQSMVINESLHIIPNSLYYYFKNRDNNIGLDDLSMLMGNLQKYLFVLPKIIQSVNCDNCYEYIIFDTPPSSNLITQSAFLLSDYLIIPTIMDDISIKGVEHYWHKIKSIYNTYCRCNKAADYYMSIFGSEVKFIGLFETMRKGNSCDTEDALRTKIKSDGEMNLFETIIKDISSVVTETIKISAALNPLLNVGEGVGREDCRRGYKKLCEEIVKCL